MDSAREKVAAPRFDRGTSGFHIVSMGPARYTSCAMLLHKVLFLLVEQHHIELFDQNEMAIAKMSCGLPTTSLFRYSAVQEQVQYSPRRKRGDFPREQK